MSSRKWIIGFCICCCASLANCEDTHSPKKNTQKNPAPTTKTAQQPTNQPLQKEATAAVNKEETFKLTNENVRTFMAAYGKENTETVVAIDTKFGSIHIQLYTATPMHRANFIYLVKEGYFDETFFYRVAKGFVIQGGNSDRTQMAQKRFEIGDYTLPQEPVAGLKHHRGAVALSKQWVNNPSNRSTPYEFFIVVAKNGAAHLDGEHTIFGKVIKGIKIVDKIANVPVDASEWPKENIFIKARIIR